MIAVLMYHAIPPAAADGQDLANPERARAADPHYSVAAPVFEAQMRALIAAGLAPRSVRDIQAAQARGQDVAAMVGITFDDGHASNLGAAELLHRLGASADFFVNPSTVGTPGFLDWDALRRMHALGMSIQSHGQQHVFLDDLGPAEVDHQLGTSREAIQQALGQPVTLYAPAGGRQPPGFAATARRHGYALVCSSRVGLWAPQDGGIEVPRFAVLARTSQAQLLRWARRAPAEMAWQLGRYQALRQAKRLLGNGLYVRLRGRLLRQAAP